MRRSICPICTVKPANTKEDVIPNWFRRELRRLDFYAGASNFPSVLVRICGDCNSTFGQRYETETADIIKPLLHGDHRIVPPSSQVVIVRWTIKTVLLFAIARLSNFPSVFRENIRSLCLEMKIKDVLPRDALVRVGYGNPIVTTDPPNPALHNAGELPDGYYRSVVMLGMLAWEVVIGSPGAMSAFAATCPDSNALLKIWPPRNEELAWPPPKRMTMQDVYYLRAAWQAQAWPPPEGTVLRQPEAWRSEPVKRSNRVEGRAVED